MVSKHSLEDGFLNLNKPASWTSHDCVAKVRKLLKLKRIGHGGTLDPAATGVLPLAIGRTTRLLQFLKPDKAYQATIRLGIATNTDDLEGNILSQKPVPNLELNTVKIALQDFQGVIQQVPPRYSAIQVKGKRLYALARTGETFDPPIRTVEIHHLEILDWRPGDFPELDLNIRCGAGTYIRAIARDLGSALQTGGTLATLIRTESSGFLLTESLTLNELEQQLKLTSLQPIAPEKVLAHLSVTFLPLPMAKRWCQGQQLLWEKADSSCEPLQVRDEQGKFLGIGQIISRSSQLFLTPKVVFEVI